MSDKFLRLERGQAEIVPVQKAIFSAKTSAYLMPVVAVFGNETLLCFREIGDRSWLLLPTRTLSWLPFFDRGRLYFLGFSLWKKKKKRYTSIKIEYLQCGQNKSYVLFHMLWTYHHQKLGQIQRRLQNKMVTLTRNIWKIRHNCY